MTATDRLRAMLDERGVEWGNIRNNGSESDYLTEWQFEDNQGEAVAIEWAVGSGLSVEIHRYHLTPEQAIAATLGTGTCKLTMDGTDGCFGCSECLENIPPLANFCPNCGRRVEVGE